MTTDTTPQERIEAASEPEAKERIASAIKQLGLTFEYKFIPFSQSRNKAEKSPSLNWNVTLKRGNSSMSFDYSAGCGHCPADKLKWPEGIGSGTKRYRLQQCINAECETGFAHRWDDGSMTIAKIRINRKETPDEYNQYKTEYVSKWIPVLPKDASIIHSLALDASVLDSGSFEEWASEFGYDTDSRAAEAVYKACLEIALKLRAMIGDTGLRDLQEACQDY